MDTKASEEICYGIKGSLFFSFDDTGKLWLRT